MIRYQASECSAAADRSPWLPLGSDSTQQAIANVTPRQSELDSHDNGSTRMKQGRPHRRQTRNEMSSKNKSNQRYTSETTGERRLCVTSAHNADWKKLHRCRPPRQSLTQTNAVARGFTPVLRSCNDVWSACSRSSIKSSAASKPDADEQVVKKKVVLGGERERRDRKLEKRQEKTEGGGNSRERNDTRPKWDHISKRSVLRRKDVVARTRHV